MYAPRDDSQALTIVDSEPRPEAPMSFAWTQDDLDALHATIAKDCNVAQFKVFIAACKRLGLDPFARQIVPIVKDGRMTPQTTIDGFRAIAEGTHKYAGQLGRFWCGPDGEWKEVWLDDGTPAAAKVGVLRRDFAQPMWGVARFKSYNKGGSWQGMPDVMIAKVAESLALRKAFPQQLSGVYTPEEMDQAGIDHEPPHVNETRNPPSVRPMTPSQPAPKPTAKAKTLPHWKTLERRANYVNISSPTGWAELCRTLTGKDDAHKYTLEDYDIVERDIQEREAEAQAQHELSGVTYTDDPAAPIGTSTVDDADDLSTVGVGAHPAN